MTLDDLSNAKERQLYDATLAELLRRVQSGDCSAADVANAVKFLRDQEVTASKRHNPKLATLEARVLPFPSPTKPNNDVH